MSIHPISISTLSPVHIGCDEVYEPSNFVIADGLLHELDPADLAADLSEAERKQLAALAEGREPIGALQRFFRDNAARFAGLARHQVAVAEAIVREYEKSAGKPVQRGAAGEATYNLFPIARTAYRPFDSVPYLPGSSLKGSIRTAWLNHLNRGAALTAGDKADRKSAPRLQERLLGYAAGKFEDDPFRHIGLADAHAEEDGTPPPTRVLYAISKKKRQPRDGESGSPELKVFLETVADALPAAFLGELRLSGKIGWNALCDACNVFYKPQLEAELSHAVLGKTIDAEWKDLVSDLLAHELGDLIAARQGFLLRVGRHSGAESVTLDGVRDIKILGPRVEGKQTFDYRPNTTEKRFASLTKAGADGLLPFGWIWIDACDDAHRHLSDDLCRKLAARSSPVCDAHREQLLRLEESQRQRAAAAAEAENQKHAAEVAARAKADAEAARLAALATMSPNLRRIEEFKAAFAVRAEQLRGGREKMNAEFHGRARDLARDALAGEEWTAEEKHAAAEAIAEWLPKVVEKIDKDQIKKLKLSALRIA
jgi:CRISPR-associated protein Csm5